MTNLNVQTFNLARPEIPGALPDFPGSQQNLLPLRSLGDPLDIAIPEWPDLNVNASLRIMLSLNGQAPIQVAYYQFGAPIDPALFPFVAQITPNLFMQEGVYKVFYLLEQHGNATPSLDNYFTVDTTAPNYGNPGQRAAFPPDVVQNGITSAYLASHGDKVDITIPRYLDQRAGDIIEFYFSDLVTDGPVLNKTVHDSNSDTLIELSGAIIRAKGDGQKLAFYTPQDRADNQGPHSYYQHINVQL